MGETSNIVITGASGFVGKQLVRRFARSGVKLLLVGRDKPKLEKLFPGLDCCTYSELSVAAKGFDLLIHMAVLNNDDRSAAEMFDRVNVDLFSEVISGARAAGVKQLINVTTFHAAGGADSAYARSKRKALSVARVAKGIVVKNLFLPAVYGDSYAGNLAIVGRLPKPLGGAALNLASAFVPAIHVDRIHEYFVRGDFDKTGDSDAYLADPASENIFYSFVKRAIDLSFAMAIIVFFWWFLIAVWSAIVFTSGRPGIFAQKRVGRGGTTFVCYKFRTMMRDTKQAGTHELTAAAVTPIGALLRKTKVDELPQAWNVLRGEISLVGPRPCLPVQEDLLRERMNRGVLSVRPGITGLAQVNGIDMSDPATLARWDARYIAQQSVLGDLKIIVYTFLGRGNGDKLGE